MAILSQAENQIEVKIKRCSDNTYFDEFIKLGDREKPDAQTCDRYIVGEPGQTFTIEITIKKGYVFGDATKLNAVLYFPIKPARKLAYYDATRPADYKEGTKKDIKISMEYTRARIGDKLHSGGRFSFSNLDVDENLADATNVAELAPQSLGSFLIKIWRVIERRKMTDAENARAIRREKLAEKLYWEANKVDPHSYKAHGITSTISLVGGSLKPTSPKSFVGIHYAGENLEFNFHCRNLEIFQKLSFVKYPPPLYCYAWNLLNSEERKFALKELQEIDKDHVHKEMEVRAGQILPRPGKTIQRDNAKEWRAWGMMYAWEREAAFNTLQQARKDRERKEVQDQINERGKGVVVDLDEERKDPKLVETVESGEPMTPLTSSQAAKKGPHSQSSTETPAENTGVKALAAAQANTSPNLNGSEVNSDSARSSQHTQATIKTEFIDLDSPSPPTKRIRTAAIAQVELEIDDAELEKMEAEERKLLEEIEEAERLVKLKRKQEALHAKIEAVKALKAGRKS